MVRMATVFFALVFLLPGCGMVDSTGGDGVDQYHSSQEDAPSYKKGDTAGLVPLEAGNSWTLISCNEGLDTLTQIITVIGDTVVEGAFYHVLEEKFMNMAAQRYLMRTLECGALYVIEVGVGEYTLDTAGWDGSGLTYKGGPYSITAGRPGTVVTYAGTYENCIGFFLDIEDIEDEQRRYVVKPGVGFVECYCAWFAPYKLVSSSIGGVVYPVIAE